MMWLFRYLRLALGYFPAACWFDQFDLLFSVSHRTTSLNQDPIRPADITGGGGGREVIRHRLYVLG